MGISIAVMLLCAFGCSIPLWQPETGTGSGLTLVQFLDSFLPFPLPVWNDGAGRMIVLITLGLGIDCFRRFRRDPLTATRNLWILAATVVSFGVIYLPGHLETALAQLNFQTDLRVVAGRGGEVALALLPFVLGLLLVTLAGELFHEARRRLMREEIAEAESISVREHKRVARHERLRMSVSGPRFPTDVAAIRFITQIFLPGAAILLFARLEFRLSGDGELSAPRIVDPQVDRAGVPAWSVVIRKSGQVFLNGSVVAEPNDRQCLRLSDGLHAEAEFGGLRRVGLIIDPEVTTERIIDVLDTVERSGVTAVIIDEPVP
jgi:hypothetical protein